VSSNGALASFNSSFRAAGEAFDAKEKDARAARKSAGKAQLKKMLGEKKAAVDARKAKNREDENVTTAAMLDALQGESWARVVSLVDVHSGAHGAHAAPAAATKGAKGAAPAAAAAASAGATARMKDMLLALKAKPLSA